MNYAIREWSGAQSSGSNGAEHPAEKVHGPPAEVAQANPAAAATPHRALTEPFTEGFRLLALDIERLLDVDHNRSVVVMSALPKEGRSLAAVNLVRAFTEISPPVALVDANPVASGVAEPATDGTYQVIRPWTPDQTQAGVVEHVRRVIADARRAGGTVVIDVPPATTSSLGFFLAPSVGGVLYIARTSRIRDAAVATAVRSQLDLLGARILGVVVNEG